MPRPVFRGLRPGPPTPTVGLVGEAWVGVPRPVFRGLRLLRVRTSLLGLPRRSAETRFQGIATFNCPIHADLTGGVGVPRPVFRGLRPVGQQQQQFTIIGPSECRDPFSGDCDGFSTPLLFYPSSVGVPRPVFRGLRLTVPVPPRLVWEAGRSAETRFQGIATMEAKERRRRQKQSRSAETRFQGIAT